MKLTKLQRYTAYCIMLAEAETMDQIHSLCHLSGYLFDVYLGHPIYDVKDFKANDENEREYFTEAPVDVIFPELWEQKEHIGPYWMSNDENRIKALKKCIELTHP